MSRAPIDGWAALRALRQLRDVARAMESEKDSDKPTEQEYQAALAEADSAIANADLGSAV